MPSTYQRSLIKGVVWEGISFLITVAVVYLAYGNLSYSIKFTFWLTVAKIPIFFIHERAWKKVKWGKIKE